MSKRYELFETIIATVNLPDHQVLAGDLGTIVEVYTNPEIAYDVEFVNPDGTTRALLTLATHQIRRISSKDVITTRQAALAV